MYRTSAAPIIKRKKTSFWFRLFVKIKQFFYGKKVNSRKILLEKYRCGRLYYDGVDDFFYFEDNDGTRSKID